MKELPEVSTSPHLVFIPWDQFVEDVRWLARQIMSQRDVRLIQGIIGVARGGMIPAAILGRELEIHRVESVCCQTYEPATDGVDRIRPDGVKVSHQPLLPGGGEGFIVIDDLVDTGKTFRALKHLWPNALYVSVYAKTQGGGDSSLWAKGYGQYTWLHFPWESSLQHALTVKHRLGRGPQSQD